MKKWWIVVAGRNTGMHVTAENHTEALQKAVDLLHLIAEVVEDGPARKEEPHD